MSYQILLVELEKLLGKGYKKSKDNYAFNCPFCNHRKPKLEINLQITEKGENSFACWVCGVRGKTIHSLLKQLKTPPEQAASVLSLLPKGYRAYRMEEEILTLPKEFKLLFEASNESILAKKAKSYLFNRGITEYDLIRYQIGYCTSGDYSGRIIIPSYDRSGKLNFFTARSYENSYVKYVNPSVSRDVVFFENLIQWDYPITLVEGPFDAITTRLNAIPLLGKTLPKILLKRIMENKVEEVVVALDQDARIDALRISEKLLALGKQVKLLNLEKKDPSDLGFMKMRLKIKETPILTVSEIIKQKVQVNDR